MKSKLLKQVLPALACLICIFISGCQNNSGESAAQPTQRLLLTIKEGETTVIPPEELAGNYNSQLSFNGFSSITANIDGTEIPLQDAIRDELLTVEEIFAFARIDNRNGYCRMDVQTKKGISKFLFSYPTYKLEIIYDMLQSPDGTTHLINELSFLPVGYNGSPSFSFYDMDSNTFLDAENWGVTFDVLEATNHSITIQCNQVAGQQVGHLETSQFLIFGENLKENQHGQFIILEPESIAMEGSCQLFYDWSDTLDRIATGEYYFRLYLKDIYTPSEIHPLVQKHYDRQYYDIPFVVE